MLDAEESSTSPSACLIASDASAARRRSRCCDERVVASVIHRFSAIGKPRRSVPPVVWLLEARLASVIVDFLVEEVEAGGEVAVEEARLGEAQVDLQALERAGELQAQELAVAEQVALGDADVADDAFSRRVAGAERQLAGRLLDHLHVEDDAVGRRAGPALDVDGLEEAQALQALLGPVDHQRIVGVAFGQAELAPDDVVLGARVADDVDALDVDARAFVDRRS